MKLVKFSSRFCVAIILFHHLSRQLVVVHELIARISLQLSYTLIIALLKPLNVAGFHLYDSLHCIILFLFWPHGCE